MTGKIRPHRLTSEGWAVELLGHKIDLDDLRENLRPPFFPFVEDYVENETTTLILRSDTWSLSENANGILADARRLIAQINGAHLLTHGDALPVTLGRAMRFRADGTQMPVVIAAAASISLQGVRVRARAVVEDDKMLPQARPSVLQNWINEADRQNYVADLLNFLTRSDNWFDIYKAMEDVERLSGGEHAAKKRWPDWARAVQTANRERHAPAPSLPANASAPTLEEARQIVLAAARQLHPFKAP